MNTHMHLLKGATLLCVCLLVTPSLYGQGTWTRKALELAQNNQYEEAERQIQVAIDNGEGADPLTWYVQAFVLKSLFVERDGRHPESTNRTAAIASAFESAQRDPEGKLNARRAPLLSFLADTHLEDARDGILLSQPGDATASVVHFEAYSEINRHLNQDWDATPDAVLLDQQLAEHAFRQAELEEPQKASTWFNWGQVCYQNALSKGHDQYRSEYNLAVHTYNQGVRQFKAAENDLDAIDGALKAAAILWQAAADGLERALEIDADQRSGYEALAVVSEALLKQDKIKWCKAHLVELGQR
jgi:tetratricopeptide (TPR) repeat protein